MLLTRIKHSATVTGVIAAAGMLDDDIEPPVVRWRLDRIYQEAEATGGDIRLLCDLFGMSIANAARWATTVGPDRRHSGS